MRVLVVVLGTVFYLGSDWLPKYKSFESAQKVDSAENY